MLRKQPQNKDKGVCCHDQTPKRRRGDPRRDRPGELTRACKGRGRKRDRWEDVQTWAVLKPRVAESDC